MSENAQHLEILSVGGQERDGELISPSSNGEWDVRHVIPKATDTSPATNTPRARNPYNGRFLAGDCEIDCQERCAYPGQFGCD